MRRTVKIAWSGWQVLLLFGASCAAIPEGLVLRCAADGSCPEGLTCQAIDGERYCVAADGGAGGAGGGTSGGSSAGGGAAGGSSIAGGASGGSIAGGMSGGASGGLSTGGGMSGGASGGSSTGGGMSGGASGGSSTGGGVSGGASGGSSTGGGMAGGASGGMSMGGGTAGGGSTAGGASGGSSGGATAGGAGGGFVVTDGGLLFPGSHFRAIAGVAIGSTAGAPAFVTLRELGDGTVIAESWTSDLASVAERRFPPNGGLEPTQLASNRTITAIGSISPAGYSISNLDPATLTSSQSFALLGSPPTVRLRVFEGTTAPVFPTFVLTNTSNGVSSTVTRLDPVVYASVALTSTMFDGAFGDDFVEIPGNRLAVVGRCVGLCTFGAATSSSTESARTLRYATSGFSALPDAGINQSPAIQEFGAAGNAFADLPVRIASDGLSAFVLAGVDSGNGLRIERRLFATGAPAHAPWTSSTATRAVDLLRSATANTVLILASVPATTVLDGQMVTVTTGNERNVLVIRVDGSSTLGLTTWDVPGDQVPVAFTHIAAATPTLPRRLIIVGNEGPNGFLWNVPHPP